MDTTPVTLDRNEARALYRKYKEHLHYSSPIDHEIMRAYQLIAQGRLIIKAVESVIKAGIGVDYLPKLALSRASAEFCYLNDINENGRCVMSSTNKYRREHRAGTEFRFPIGSFPGIKHNWNAQALVPTVPLHLKPGRGLANYHVLFEADWKKQPTRDPYLLRRIGIGDMWLVVAMWNLTEVERAALETRI